MTADQRTSLDRAILVALRFTPSGEASVFEMAEDLRTHVDNVWIGASRLVTRGLIVRAGRWSFYRVSPLGRLYSL